MTEQSVIRVLLLAVLVWRLAVWWCLFARYWLGWERLRRWRKPERRKRRPRLYKKPKPFEGLTRKPVCVACLAEGEAKESAERREAPSRIERDRGRRPRLAIAQRLVHGAVSVLAPGVVPLFVTDQLAAYTKALLTHFGCWVERTSERSGRVVRRWVPDDRLRYAQVRKRRARHRIVEVSTRVSFGTSEAIHSMLRALGQKINTAYIECVNRTLRAHVPGLLVVCQGSCSRSVLGVSSHGES